MPSTSGTADAMPEPNNPQTPAAATPTAEVMIFTWASVTNTRCEIAKRRSGARWLPGRNLRRGLARRRTGRFELTGLALLLRRLLLGLGLERPALRAGQRRTRRRGRRDTAVAVDGQQDLVRRVPERASAVADER